MQLPGGPPLSMVNPAAPCGFAIGAETMPDGTKLVLMRMETVYGTQVFPMSPKAAQDLINQLTMVTGGIHVVRDMPDQVNGSS